MIVKIVGGALLILSCWLVGYCMALNLKIRKQSLQDVRVALLELKNQIGFAGASLSDAFAEVAAQIRVPASELFDEFSKNLNGDKPVPEVWHGAVESVSDNLSLNNEDKRLIQNFGKMLGNSDIEGQISNIELTTTRLELQIADSTDRDKRLGAIFKYAGVAAGVALTLILL